MTLRAGFWVFIYLFLIFTGSVFSMESESFKITTSVMSGGGGGMSSASFKSNSVLGQPTSIMEQGLVSGSSSFNLYSGFFYTLVSDSFCPWDLSTPLDGDTDGLDLYRFVFDGYDAIFQEGFSNEFGRNNCLD